MVNTINIIFNTSKSSEIHFFCLLSLSVITFAGKEKMFLSVETKEAKQAILSMGKVQQTVIYEVPIPGKSGKVGIAAI